MEGNIGLFGLLGKKSKAEADPRELRGREFLRQLDDMIKAQGGVEMMQIVASEDFQKIAAKYLPSDLTGPGKPLHAELSALMNKINSSGLEEFKDQGGTP